MIISADCQLGFGFRQGAEGMLMFQLCFASEDVEADALQSRGRTSEVGIDQFFIKPDRLEHLRALIAL